MAKVCSLCKSWQAPGPTDTTMDCPHDGADVATETRCGVCSTTPRAWIALSAEDIATNESQHNTAPGHVFE